MDEKIFVDHTQQSKSKTDSDNLGHQSSNNTQFVNSSNSTGQIVLGNKMQIFIAYPYCQYPLPEYRTLFRSLEKLFDVKFLFADEKITNLHILQKIENFIRESDTSIFEITGWNANVALELGLAIGLGKRGYIAFNTEIGSYSDVPSDIRGFERIQFSCLGELRQNLHALLGELQGIKGRIFKAEDLTWNPRGRPTPTAEDYVAAFRNIKVQLVPLLNQPNQMIVDLSVQIESRDWRCINDDNAPWMHIDFLDDHRQKIEVQDSMHWFPLEFQPNQKRYHYQQKILVSDRWAEIVDINVWTSAGYAQSTVWYKNWYPHMIYARLRQKVTSSRRRFLRY